MSDIATAQAAIHSVLVAPPLPLIKAGPAEFGAINEARGFPRVTYGTATSDPIRLSCLTGSDGALQVDTWSKQTGKDGLGVIMAAIRERLDLRDVPTEKGLVRLRVEQERIVPRSSTDEPVHGVQIIVFQIVRSK